MMKYSLGGFFTHFAFNRELLLEREQNPNMFHEDARIDTFFDSFPNIVFNGGRPFVQKKYDNGRQRMEEMVRFYNDRGIGIRYTYSNTLLEERHLDDPVANLTLEIAHNPLNGIIVASPLLEAYIRRKYPKYQLVISTTVQSFDRHWLKKRSEEVDLVVLPIELNFDRELIEYIGPKKIEIMVNEGCAAYCPHKKEHYAAASRDQLNGDEHGTLSGAFFRTVCPNREGTTLWESGYRFTHRPVRLSLDQMREVHSDPGVENFKIICRKMPIQMFYGEVKKYLMKPEYWNITRLGRFVDDLVLTRTHGDRPVRSDGRRGS
jgi:collagenase-like PrtC family protease